MWREPKCLSFAASITHGIGIGFIVFCILRIATGRWREVPVALYVVSAVFAFYYLMPALHIGQ
ncbi:putative MFS transporter, AGZA family, xanthine/uracil permease [Streptacidiphilus jiangxiensis]|uniref:Putative MFS transporter, AGZA family, xanthine/uracil permease n=1 Tax=Streptacidiphilus jiangxiensis TaxID=235985 RepID=A0A1H7Q6J5_STRJI|nr:putative MFS transporter, AGZA family, xanthine/uracil permease [Streptacidiphilus jiangxiensis]